LRAFSVDAPLDRADVEIDVPPSQPDDLPAPPHRSAGGLVIQQVSEVQTALQATGVVYLTTYQVIY
jgi:hypothetical protein